MYDPGLDYMKSLSQTIKSSPNKDERDRAMNTALIIAEYWASKDKKQRERLESRRAEKEHIRKENEKLVEQFCIFVPVFFVSLAVIIALVVIFAT